MRLTKQNTLLDIALIVIAMVCLATAAVVPQLNAEPINVTWEFESSDEPTIDGFRIKFGTESGIYTGSVDAARNVRTFPFDGTLGITYYFVVLPYKGADEAVPTGEAEVTVNLAQATNIGVSNPNTTFVFTPAGG